MKTLQRIIPAVITAMLLAGPTAEAQRGVGDPEGVVRQGITPDRIEITGTLVRTKEGPCENTTGRAYIGTHYFLETADGTVINLHLGPTESMKAMELPMEIGKTVSAQAFRTEKMKENDYVAIQVTVDDTIYVLRDADLKPVWSYSGRRDGRGGRSAWWRR